MDALSPDVLEHILSYMDMFSLSKMSMTSKDMERECNNNELWRVHYQNIQYNKKLRLTDASEHIADCTYHSCGVGGYPGWRWRHSIITDPLIIRECKKVHHYNNLVGPKINYKNFKKQCAKRWKTYTLNKIENKWCERDEHMLSWAKVKVQRAKKHLNRSNEEYNEMKQKKERYALLVDQFKYV